MASEKLLPEKNIRHLPAALGAIIKKKQPLQVVSFCIKANAKGRFPPDLTGLFGLGFERVSSSHRSSLVRKIEGTDLFGKPYLFTEVEISKKEVRLRYSIPGGQDPALRHLHACTLMARVLSIVPGLELCAKDACGTMLSALESSSGACTSSYSELSKKSSDLQKEAAALRVENMRLRRTCEEEAALSIEREGQISTMASRVSKLEAVSDLALAELLLEWLSSHRGSFSTAFFSKQSGVSAARAEEGLEQLLKSGAIKRVGGRLVPQKAAKSQEFELQQAGIGRSLSPLLARFRIGRAKESNFP